MFRLPRLPSTQPAWSKFQTWWQRVVEQIEAEINTEIDTINRIRRLISHTVPTTMLDAEDVGATITITILDHTRVYADGTTLAVTGGVQTGFDHATWYACYYDDETLADTTPSFIFTTDTSIAQAAVAAGRHWCGMVLTPDSSTGDTISSGGAYPVGAAAVQGELL